MGKILGKRSVCFDVFATPWMDESQSLGMKALTLEFEFALSIAGIYLIPKKRVSNMSHMNTNLVGSSGL